MQQARIGNSGAGVFCFLFNFASNLTHFRLLKFKMCQLRDTRQKIRLFRIIRMRGKLREALLRHNGSMYSTRFLQLSGLRKVILTHFRNIAVFRTGQLYN